MSTQATGNGAGVWDAQPGSEGGAAGAVSSLVAERPEVAAGAAFVGGIVLALIVRRLGR